MKNPLHAINHYLWGIYKEAESRNYRFDESKIGDFQPVKMTVTSGQLAYERKHLLNKLQVRDKERFEQLCQVKVFEPVSLFEVKKGEIEAWEVGVIEK